MSLDTKETRTVRAWAPPWAKVCKGLSQIMA